MKTKHWAGVEPKYHEGIIAQHPDGWALYLVKRGKGDWYSVKLVATKPQAHKGNYWLGYNTKEQRFARSPASELLRENRPEMAAWVGQTVEQYAGAGALPAQPARPPSSEPAQEIVYMTPEDLADDIDDLLA